MKNSYSRLSDQNTYGGYTWMFKFDPVYHIFIHSDNSSADNFVVEFKEWGFLKYKKPHFSFISNKGLVQVLELAFEKAMNFMDNVPKYRVDRTVCHNNVNFYTGQLLHSNDPITKDTIFG
ncbi:MAG: hypothetical protein GXO79_09330 [Chlorobi bacterium]|nr:hypothetical protein [Chlorobiota bacterium]